MVGGLPSLFQRIVLHCIDSDEVVFEGELFDSGQWFMWMPEEHVRVNKRVNVTRQMEKLIDLGMVQVMIEFPGIKPRLTERAQQLIKREPLHDLMEQLERKRYPTRGYL